jgi:lipid A 3-O-deacylase
LRVSLSKVRQGLLAGAAVVVGAFSGMGGFAPHTAAAQDPSLLTLSLGYFDIIDNDDSALAGGVEWMSGKRLWIFQPMVGVMATTEASLYGYAGVGTDFFFGNRWVLTPSIAVGAYSDGDGKDLGHTIEFRSAITIAYRFDNHSRLGLRFYHLSNAGLGGDGNNPGVEVLDFTYSIPLR